MMTSHVHEIPHPDGPAGGTAFGVMLRSLRRAARLTLEELSETSGVSVRALGDLERGRSRGPQRRTVDALAGALRLAAEQRERLQRLADTGRERGGAPPAPYLLRTVADFTGREQELADLQTLATGTRTRAAVLFGPGGQGKTTLAAEAVRRLAGAFPDGTVCVQLHGMSDTPLPAAEALVLLLTALGHPPDRIPVDPVAREAVYRATLAGRRALVVLDDAVDEAHTRPLLPDAEGSFVLVTSRRPLAGLEGVRRIRLGGLSGGESARLLERILGAPRTDGQSEAITRLTELCGHLPLALRIVGNRLSSRPGWTPARLVGHLADEGRRLSGLVAGDLAVRSALALSYGQLTEPHRLLLRRLALVPGHDTGPDLAAVLTGNDPLTTEDSLDLLVDRGLLEETASGRYALHDLVRLFAREQLAAEETESAAREVRLRMADWLLRSASAAGRRFEAPGAPEPWPGETAAFSPESAEEAEEWLTAERANWAGALPVLFAADRHEEILRVSRTLYWFSDRWCLWPEWRTLFSHGARSAAALGDRAAEAHQLNCLAWAHSVGACRYAEAEQLARRALELASETGDVDQQAWAWSYISGACMGQGRPAEAAEAAARATRLFETTGDSTGKAVSQRVLGTALRESGRAEEALALHRALLGTRPGDVPGLGEFVAALLRCETAKDLLALERWSEAAEAFRAVGTPSAHAGIDRLRAHTSLGLATALEHRGDPTEARELYRRAHALFTEFGDTTSAKEAASGLERLGPID
ncbi:MULTISPECIES: helix-turn-helix domain-containing protein [unclassified Streptomyces]|uniref:ATP-binding protein n=2 Tax=unclassified Streptomyces TaxID=2593676 RepID=UPI002474AF38|nr:MULTISPECIES: helix-turn-helix domain-containing protein [unclassified Streptomyces]MDH6449747.1 transcriptional regulator with XRE-family HTH domain/tetratricopeptide (TPR) repeat protein [Streptomyces sp. SAI-119]MDH6499803.1 transcriptional regulator with XRE-family HTH domain/tetratricopeptide (TPR) repeat protein [Streptomyces sp. SAI-149]